MSAITCQEWAALAGWRCAPVADGDARALYITTPLTFPDGKPLDFYLRDTRVGYEMTDDGMTLFALRGLGYAIDDRRNWRGIERLAEQFGFELTPRGELRAAVPVERVTEFCGRILQLFAGFIAWEAERFRDADSDFSLTREVERLLRLKDAARPLARDVVVPAGKGEVHFHFQWGDTYVDAIKPTAQAVAARLRKAILIGAADDEQIKVLFVVDDRADREKATREMAVLAHVARTVRYSDFQRAA